MSVYGKDILPVRMRNTDSVNIILEILYFSNEGQFLLFLISFLLASCLLGGLGTISKVSILTSSGSIGFLLAVVLAIDWVKKKKAKTQWQKFQGILRSSLVETENIKTLKEIEDLFKSVYPYNPEKEKYYTELTEHLRLQYAELVANDKLTVPSEQIKERLEHIFKNLEIKQAKQILPAYERKLVNEIEEAIDNSKDPELVKERLAKLATHVTSLAKDKGKNERLTQIGFWIGVIGFIIQLWQLIPHFITIFITQFLK